MSRVATFLFSLFTFLYFCSLLWLTAGVPLVFTSPDENANFTFASTIAATGDVRIADDINLALNGIVHPRSTVVLGALTLPGSFLGWPIVVGVIGTVAAGSPYVMLLVTPILVMLALAAWWGIARKFGDDRFAWIATVLLALHPAFWYYAARGMMHNVPFVCLLILGAWLVTWEGKVKSEKRKVAATLGAGLLIGLALCIRVNEAIWVLPLAIFLLWKVRDAAKPFLFSLFSFLFFAALPLVGLGAVNTHLYGSPFATGYTITTTNGELRTTEGTANGELRTANDAAVEVRSSPFEVLLPFGFHPRAMLKNVWHYGVALFPWMTLLAIIGIATVILMSVATKDPIDEVPRYTRDDKERAWIVLTWVTLGLALWLGIVYGSWLFNDNPDPTAITIGDSHLRYWLPLFVLSTLFGARAVASLERKEKSEKRKVAAWLPSAIIVSAIAILSGVLVFGGDDGLLRTRQVLFESAAKRDAIIAVTEDSAIIVVDRADKFLFPHRRVIQPLRSDATYAVLADAVKLAPLYYYGIPFPDVDMTYLNDVKLAALGLRIDAVTAIGDETLYRISPSL